MAEKIVLDLLGKLASMAVREVSVVWGVEEELNKLQKTLISIKAAISDAEQHQPDAESGLQNWITKLRDVLYDVEVVLDEFHCETLRKQVVHESGAMDKVRHFVSRSNPVAVRMKMGHKLKRIRKRLDEIKADKDLFDLKRQSNISTGSSSRNKMREPTHSFALASNIIGRDHDKDAIIEQLICPHGGTNPFVVSIVGMGGLGKTALAKLVYNDERVKQLFELRIWVCAPENFDVSQLMRNIVASTTHENIDHFAVETFQVRLREVLKEKKFLILLDDVWNENHRIWKEFSDLLTEGATGSSIIVTTRSLKVASAVGTNYEHKLLGLSNDSCMSLLLKGLNEKQEKITDPKLLEILNEIVEKCGGIPLAVKALGGLLRSKKDVTYWKSIKDILTILQKEDDILPILKLSYDQLPPHLRRCIAYCSFFPQDHYFWSHRLCNFWLASGLVESSEGNQEPEHVVDQYIKELLSRSFFQEFQDFGATSCFKMHDLVHNLLLSVAQQEFNFDIPSNVSERTRHVSLTDLNMKDELNMVVPKFLHKASSMQTLLIFRSPESSPIQESFVKACISSCRCLRLLDLEGSSFEAMPSSIDTLKHLRALNLTNNHELKRLQRSICNLQSLEVLSLFGCNNFEELPRDMWKLISLRSLFLTTKERCLKDSGIEYLKSLRHLYIKECNNLESLLEGMDLKVGLTALRTLAIESCSNLTSIPIAGLKHLTSLERLGFESCPKLCLSPTNEIFPLSLKTFQISALPRIHLLPEWVQGSADTIQFIGLFHWSELEALPEWFQKLTQLKWLVINGCSSLDSMPEGIQSLTSLRKLNIENCANLAERCLSPNGKDWHKISHIEEIYIDGKWIK